MKICSIGYVPPESFVGARSFYENIRQFKTEHDLILFSEADWPGIRVRLKMSPEAPYLVDGGRGKPPRLNRPHKFVINNLIYFTALKMAREAGYTHALYLESDVRVSGDHWDGKIFAEYFSLGRPLICGGTLAVYNPASFGMKALRRWEKLVVEQATKVQGKPYAQCRKNIPIATYGWKPDRNIGVSASERFPSCVFPNGALSIISLNWAHELFVLSQPATMHALNKEPFDMSLGRRIWERFEEDSYDVVGHLNSLYSGYGDVVTSPDERKAMLQDGRYCAVHQIKDEWSA